ncbi:MAG: hypothetical protein J7K72_02255 [Candidatus Aenigmarchaeota archaeon]|nr:hypothetical protein [Candidatus Aenigmarchaeota archaeon]
MEQDYVDLEEVKRKVRLVRKGGALRNPKDMAIEISVSAVELLEVFEGVDEKEEEKILSDESVVFKIKTKLEDITKLCKDMARELGIDLS